MKKFLTRFLSNKSGATAIEYGLIASAMALVLVAGMAIIGPAITQVFTDIAAQL